MNEPSGELHAAVLNMLLRVDPRSWSVAATTDDLFRHLTAEEAEQLPAAMGGVLPLLRSDPERMRRVAEIAVRFDLFEIARPLAELALDTGDRQLLLAVASLCGNPAVESHVRSRVADAVADDPAVRIRLDPTAVPKSADEERLLWQLWPGARRDDGRFALAPVVVLDRSFSADVSMRFAVRLVEAGATVRRLAGHSPVPFWFGAQTVLVCTARTRLRVRNHKPEFPLRRIIVADIRDDERVVRKLLRSINAALTGSQLLRLEALGPQIATNYWEPGVFTAGVYQTREVAFLSGAATSTLYGMCKRGLLKPWRDVVNLWKFSDLVAIRTWAYLKSLSPGRVRSKVIPALAGFAGDSEAVNLGVTSQGRVLVDRGNGWEDVETDQRHLDLPITDVDDAFRPFPYGRGTVVNLLKASPNTRLDPTVLHGTPYLDGHRISAKALARLSERGGMDLIRACYPELDSRDIDDTVSIGLQLLRAV